MNYPTHDTDWAISAKGNTWRRINGLALVIGERKDGRWWARRGDDFLSGSFPSKEAAMLACEQGTDGDEIEPDFDLWEMNNVHTGYSSSD